MTVPQGRIDEGPLGGEWVLLANALADPIEQIIAVEVQDPAQMREVEQRLAELAGLRPVLWQSVQPGGESAENLWRSARDLVQAARDQAIAEAPSIPLLIVVIGAWSEAPAEHEQLAAFWRGMNQLRERWHDIPAQVVLLLSPIAYEHLTLNADHLKRWIGLKVHLGAGTVDLAELLRPGTVLGRAVAEEQDAARVLAAVRARRLQGLDLLARQAREAEGRGEGPAELARRYYLPLAAGWLAVGDRDQARAWRGLIADPAALDPEDLPGLARLDEGLGAAGFAFDVFLSHHRQDTPAALALGAALRIRGIRIWLNEEQLLPGAPWLSMLEAGVRASRTVAVLIGAAGLGPWQGQELGFAFGVVASNRRPIIPVLLPGAPVSLLPSDLADRIWVDLRSGIDAKGLDRLVWGITGQRPIAH